MKEQNGVNTFLRAGLRALLVGIGIYLIFSAAFVLVFWFTSIPENLMTYCAAASFAISCLFAGLKLGSGIGKKGILVGLAAGVVMTLILWGVASLVAGTEVFKEASAIKFAAGIISGILGGMIGVNTSR